MQKIPVMVTGVGGGGHGEQIFKALKLAKTPYHIVGGDMNSFSLGLAKVDIPYILPPANHDGYIDSLLTVCKRHDICALFHGSEPELKVMSENRELFKKAGIFLPINPPEVIHLCMNKLRLSEWLKSKGFEVPKTIHIKTEADLDTVDFFPAVLKPMIGGGGSANLFLAQDKNDLQFYGRSLLTNIGPYIVQEYIGTTESEYTVGILSDMEGRLINSIAVRRMILSGLSNLIKIKNRTGRQELGPVLAISSGISQGKVGVYTEVTEPCEKISQALGATGAINIQCRLVKGKVYVFEINPRFSGTTSIRAMMGFNEPDLLIRKYVLDEEITPRFSYQTGEIARGLSEIILPDKRIRHAF
jgi:carbamoyl-phosphate synthase large subunit